MSKELKALIADIGIRGVVKLAQAKDPLARQLLANSTRDAVNRTTDAYLATTAGRSANRAAVVSHYYNAARS